MNAQESQLLNDLLNQLVQVKGIVKDRDAEAMIARAVAQQPDAAYLLVQRVLLQEQALEAAKQQIASLQNRLQERQEANTSFLGSSSIWGHSGGQSVNAAKESGLPAQPVQTPSYQPDLPQYQTAQRPAWSSGMGSFLGTAAATAAGVAGGAFLFQGLENLLGHHGAGAATQQVLGDLSMGNAMQDNGYRDAGTASDNSLSSAAGLDDIATAGQFGNADDLAAMDDTNSLDDSDSLDDSGGNNDFGADDDTVV